MNLPRLFSVLLPTLATGCEGNVVETDDPTDTGRVVLEGSAETLDLGYFTYEDTPPTGTVTLTNRSGERVVFGETLVEGDGAGLLLVTGSPADGAELADDGTVTFTLAVLSESVGWRTGWFSATLTTEAALLDGTATGTFTVDVLFKIRCDLDGDGYDATACGGTDCEDADATIRPGLDDICNLVDDDCDLQVDEDPDLVWTRDADGDGYGDVTATDQVAACYLPTGYSADASDCDDTSAEVHPDADEYCNELDDDCDAEVDEDALDPNIRYEDADGDGFGGDVILEVCGIPSGYVTVTGDCDDTNDKVHPRNKETCDGTDEDCDGIVDEEPADGVPFFADTDGDGYGDGESFIKACATTTGYVEDDTDCDDTDAGVYPGAVDLCAEGADGVDNDCNGVVDNTDEAVTYYQDRDGDGHGDPSRTVATCSGIPAGYVLDDTDCDDESLLVYPGSAEVCDDGVDEDCDGQIDCDDKDCGGVLPCSLDLGGADAVLTGETAGDRAGAAVASAGDVDGDGRSDLFIGATGENTGGSDAGAAYVVYGPITGNLGLARADVKLLGEAADDQVGLAIASAGDTNADGYSDLILGAANNDAGGVSGGGCVYLVNGPVTSSPMDLDAASARLRGTASGDGAGIRVVGVGDTDGDGLDDLLAGAANADDPYVDAGAAYLVPGGITGDRKIGLSAATLQGENASDKAGSFVGAVGDLDGDGFADVMVGAPGSDTGATDGGIVYIVRGPVTGETSLAVAEVRITGAAASDGLYQAAIGDLDGDGVMDLLAGTEGDDTGGTSAGAVYALLGPLEGSLSVSTPDDMLAGSDSSDFAGESLAIVGDTNGALGEEVVVGSYNAYYGTLRTGVATYLEWPWKGIRLEDGGIPFGGIASGDRAGDSVAAAGDVDRDGVNDILVGASYEDTAGSSAGAAYLILGSNF